MDRALRFDCSLDLVEFDASRVLADMKTPLITAIVSTYCASRFFRGCLDDLVAQSILDELEILVVDSGSLEDESAICRDYVERFSQIRLIRTEREPLYVAWNRAIDEARGKFLTNANTDDRHSPDYMEKMVLALENAPRSGLAYADQYISNTANETFQECELRGARVRRAPTFTALDLFLRCITGSQPMWRKELHKEVGYFDPRYRIAADYDMWIRFAAVGELLHVPQTLGVFYDSPETISGSNNRLRMDLESMDLKRRHIAHPRFREIPGLRESLSRETFGVGYRYIESHGDGRAAKPFIWESFRLYPPHISFLKTYALRCLFR